MRPKTKWNLRPHFCMILHLCLCVLSFVLTHWIFVNFKNFDMYLPWLHLKSPYSCRCNRVHAGPAAVLRCQQVSAAIEANMHAPWTTQSARRAIVWLSIANGQNDTCRTRAMPPYRKPIRVPRRSAKRSTWYLPPTAPLPRPMFCLYTDRMYDIGLLLIQCSNN